MKHFIAQNALVTFDGLIKMGAFVIEYKCFLYYRATIFYKIFTNYFFNRIDALGSILSNYEIVNLSERLFKCHLSYRLAKSRPAIIILDAISKILTFTDTIERLN
jgi:hypothetical protein